MENSDLILAIKKSLSSPRAKNYSYLIIFFLLFSFFVFFAIRPSVIMVISLKNEEQKLTLTNKNYENIIGKIVNIQSQLQSIQDKIYLLPQALPPRPEINKVLQDILENGKKNSVTIKRLNVDQISLAGKDSRSLHSVGLSMEFVATYDNMLSFLKDLANQRRLKTIEKLDLKKESTANASESANLDAIIKISTYYL